MSDVILKVENVSKLYRLGTLGTGTFGGDVQRFWKTRILGQEDPFLKIGQTNDRTSKDKVDFVWVLKDINFEVKRGEVLGIIGKNGAGKSTLLKLLSRITSPTTGSIKCAGRMASLLEVGTGFHPELTGRENIYLNGAILGMTKKEIQNKFDEIVEFSGCELYIDTPTKRYSSGMTVRLGFAVAAFLDPEILVVDEVLAVGDAEFQKKAIGKMKEVSSKGGRTVLFVSHNLESIKTLCTRCVLMENGKLKNIGSTEDIIHEYMQNEYSASSNLYLNPNENSDEEIILKSVEIHPNHKNIFVIENETKVTIKYKLNVNHKNVCTSIHLNQDSVKVFCAGSESHIQNIGEYEINYIIPANLLNNTSYSIDIFLIYDVINVKVHRENIVMFECIEIKNRKEYFGKVAGVVRPFIQVNKPVQI